MIMTRLLSLYLLVSVTLASTSSTECTNSANGECINASNGCLDTSAFQKRVASFNDDESILPSLRGTIDDILSQNEIDTLLELLPMSDFVDAGGYNNNNKDGQGYNAPVAYAGLGLKELSTAKEIRYKKLLEIREKVRLNTERSLGLCPGTLLVDFTTISQKTEGGAHRPHADNCLHYFDDDTKKGATCDPSRIHPYPKRIAASILYLNNPSSGNFMEGEFYFAKRSNGEVDVTVPVKAGTMIYFTSGVENLHGALPVKRRTDLDEDAEEPRRLALAMWYVSEQDQELKEYVPTFQEAKQQSSSSGDNNNSNNAERRKAKPKQVHDPNDPTAPKELFSVPIPKNVDITTLFQSMGAYLSSQEKNGSWKVSQDGEDTLHVLFKDHSALFTLDFGVALDDEVYAESSVVVERHTDGRKPASLQYMLQESVMMHGVLDALSKLMLEKLEEDEQVEQYFKGEVEKARSTLPAKRA